MINERSEWTIIDLNSHHQGSLKVIPISPLMGQTKQHFGCPLFIFS